MHSLRIVVLFTALMMAAGHASAFERYTSSVALIIGNSDYVNGWSDLPGVAEDVQAVQQFLLEELAFDVVEAFGEQPEGEGKSEQDDAGKAEDLFVKLC